MSTITLELPDELASFLADMDPERRLRFAVVAFERQRKEESAAEVRSIRLSAATWTLIEEGLDDIEAGRTTPFDKEAELRRGIALMEQWRQEQGAA